MAPVGTSRRCPGCDSIQLGAGISRGRTPARRRSLGGSNRRAGRWHSFGGSLPLRGKETRCYELRGAHPAAWEQIRHISSILWIVYWAGVGVTLLAAIAYWLGETRLLTRFWLYTACALALVAVVLLVQKWFTWWVTEIAVTNRHVIYKKGFIWRRTNEMNMDKVESVQVDQSILGRMPSSAPAKASRRYGRSQARLSCETASPATDWASDCGAIMIATPAPRVPVRSPRERSAVWRHVRFSLNRDRTADLAEGPAIPESCTAANGRTFHDEKAAAVAIS
jgi:Bacterial PH domain